jgi:hypothetical protein
LGAGGAENLLTDGDRRNIPNSILDVYPNGARTSQLTNAQIKTIRESSLLGRSSGGGSGPAVIETDEQRLLTRLADAAIASNLPANYLAAMPAGDSTGSQTAKANTASVPEPGLGLLGFSVLGLGVLGIARSAAKASSSSL